MNHSTQEPFDEFTAVIRELTDTANKIAQTEEAKAQAASQKRHDLIDGLIQDEQAYILKLRGLEQRRLRLSEALGWKSLTFHQILDKAALSQNKQLKPLFSELESQLDYLQQARKSAEKIIQVRLHELEVSIAQRQGGSYDNTGSINLNSPVRPKMRDQYV